MAVAPQTYVPPIFDGTAQLIKNGQAFSNPFNSSLTSLTAAVNGVYSTVNAAVSGNIFTHKDDILASIGALNTTLGRFGIHTNALSGVNLSSGLNGVNFATIAKVTATVQKYGHDGSVCELVNRGFGAIAAANNIMNAMANLIQQFNELQTFPERMVAYLDVLQTMLENQIEADLQAYADAQLTALQYAVAASLTELTQNPCVSEIIAIIGTDALKTEVKKQIPKVFN